MSVTLNFKNGDWCSFNLFHWSWVLSLAFAFDWRPAGTAAPTFNEGANAIRIPTGTAAISAAIIRRLPNPTRERLARRCIAPLKPCEGPVRSTRNDERTYAF